MHTVFWWNIPCAGMINVLKAYATEVDPTAVVVTGQLSQSRKQMGWDDKGKLFDNHVILSDDKWDEQGKIIIDKYKDSLHIFNGITHPQRMQRLIEYAIAHNITYCNMSEAYFNLEKGWRRLAKEVYLRFLLPSKTKVIAQHSQGVLCLSGNSKRDRKQFLKLGFRSESIFPFGYYTDDANKVNKRIDDQTIHLLCPGLIEYYKGVDILIEAIAKIVDEGISGFVCHITGTGSELPKIQNLVNKYNLKNFLKLEGVLNNNAYQSLIEQIDILVAPGRVEPWGIRINEAIQRGEAVVVSDGLGASKLIAESGGGAVFQTGSAFDLASKLKPFLTDSKALITAKQCNINFRENISPSHQAMSLHRIICKITGDEGTSVL